ncbi:MAG: CDP-alcohol phosphatidyltransferase family protein [Deltaproteobacteria bacterium]|nr:MAG: CDP-alcohol phosphatidyltransferase family protein [Deltaproteobacteria bacterium]
MVKSVFWEKNKERYLRIITPLRKVLTRLGVHPNILSIAGLILSIVAGFVYSTGSFFWAAWIVVLAGTCDALDGELARQTGKNSRFGAFFDSALDRYSDGFILIGLGWYFAGGPMLLGAQGKGTVGVQSPWVVVFIIMAMAGSFMVSYTRARAEALGLDCKIGLMQRPERITLLIIGSLLGSVPVVGPMFIKATLLVLAVSTNITAIHRIIHVRNQFLRENQVQ